ncbi:hypothetical protein [Homoserinibacter sp. GY 40078]|uniref:hypothetical protein n=1 Tax=Homoserinibacter sp. GY 40078 TaxID=2603275 RepID=UPI0011C91390|nr:hypothetical protein [Homoserinibacter sp. GY 40078]TXK18736.1 hypothetical protein FVQ89_01995 [Homoserinibacter sp. GY 40078]
MKRKLAEAIGEFGSLHGSATSFLLVPRAAGWMVTVDWWTPDEVVVTAGPGYRERIAGLDDEGFEAVLEVVSAIIDGDCELLYAVEDGHWTKSGQHVWYRRGERRSGVPSDEDVRVRAPRWD